MYARVWALIDRSIGRDAWLSCFSFCSIVNCANTHSARLVTVDKTMDTSVKNCWFARESLRGNCVTCQSFFSPSLPFSYVWRNGNGKKNEELTHSTHSCKKHGNLATIHSRDFSAILHPRNNSSLMSRLSLADWFRLNTHYVRCGGSPTISETVPLTVHCRGSSFGISIFIFLHDAFKYRV